MKQIRLKYIFIAAMISLVLISISICVYDTVLRGQIKFMSGLLVLVYYAGPFALVALMFWLIMQGVEKLQLPALNNLFVRILICLIAILPLLILWIWLFGVQHNFWKEDFFTYLLFELKRYWIAVAYCSISIPVILNLVVEKFADRREG
jgi:hypothetical protein